MPIFEPPCTICYHCECVLFLKFVKFLFYWDILTHHYGIEYDKAFLCACVIKQLLTFLTHCDCIIAPLRRLKRSTKNRALHMQALHNYNILFFSFFSLFSQRKMQSSRNNLCYLKSLVFVLVLSQVVERQLSHLCLYSLVQGFYIAAQRHASTACQNRRSAVIGCCCSQAR